jgi:hypothetical protein
MLRPCDQEACNRYQQFYPTFAQYVVCPITFKSADIVDYLTITAAECNPHHLNSALLNRQNFAPNEYMADFRIHID